MLPMRPGQPQRKRWQLQHRVTRTMHRRSPASQQRRHHAGRSKSFVLNSRRTHRCLVSERHREVMMRKKEKNMVRSIQDRRLAMGNQLHRRVSPRSTSRSISRRQSRMWRLRRTGRRSTRNSSNSPSSRVSATPIRTMSRS